MKYSNFLRFGRRASNVKPSFRPVSIPIVLTVIGAVSFQAQATTITLAPTAAGSATDRGPQDGTFDAFINPGFPSINNNGFESIRCAFEFDLGSVPPLADITAASLTVAIDTLEGIRKIELHGYAGDGSLSMTDFSQNAFLAGAALNPPSPGPLSFDVTPFLIDLLGTHAAYAGFNFREEPPNSPNFLVMFLATVGPYQPQLSITFSPQAVPESSGFGMAAISLLGILAVRRGLASRD